MIKSLVYNMRLRKKLFLIFGIIIAATAAGIAIGVTSFSQVQIGGKTYGVIEESMLIADNIAKLRADMAFVRTGMLSLIIEDDAGVRKELRSTGDALGNRMDELFDIVDGQLKTSIHPEVASAMAEARRAWTAFRETNDKELVPAIFAGRIKEAMIMARGVQSERYGDFSAATKKAVDHVRGDVPVMVAKMKRESSLVKALFLAGGALFVAFYLFVALFFSKTLVTPIVMVSERATQMAQGDFSRNSMHARGTDEIGAMIGNFSTMASKIGETANHLKTSIMHLSSSSEELSATAEDLGRGASQQADQSKEISAAAAQMSQTIADVAQNAAQAADAAKHSSEAAANGKEIVEMTAERLAAITQTVQEAMQTIEGLSRSSAQIGEIVNLIHTIADQTNLLALNAAIEAARAGEQGKGFAVVADEVRKLADRTTNATKDIEQKITAIQDESQKSLVTIQKGNAEVEKGVDLARSASRSLDTIVSASTQVMDMVQRIAAATEEQSATAEEITRNMTDISGVVEHSSDATDQIRQAAHALARLASETQSMMAWFKTNGAGRQQPYEAAAHSKDET